MCTHAFDTSRTSFKIASYVEIINVDSFQVHPHPQFHPHPIQTPIYSHGIGTGRIAIDFRQKPC